MSEIERNFDRKVDGPDEGVFRGLEEYAAYVVVEQAKDMGVLAAADNEAARIASQLPGKLANQNRRRAVLKRWDRAGKRLPAHLDLHAVMSALARQLRDELDSPKREALPTDSDDNDELRSCWLHQSPVEQARREFQVLASDHPDEARLLLRIKWKDVLRVAISIIDEAEIEGAVNDLEQLLRAILDGAQPETAGGQAKSSVAASPQEATPDGGPQRVACLLLRIAYGVLIGTIAAAATGLLFGQELAVELSKAAVASFMTSVGLEATPRFENIIKTFENVIQTHVGRLLQIMLPSLSRDDEQFPRDRPPVTRESLVRERPLRSCTHLMSWGMVASNIVAPPWVKRALC